MITKIDPQCSKPMAAGLTGFLPVLHARVRSQPTRVYHHRNRQYSIVGLANAAGALVERYSYSAYGTLGIYDADLRLYHFRARWYDPATGGFISRDPLGYIDGMSLYRGYFAISSTDSNGLIQDPATVLPRPAGGRLSAPSFPGWGGGPGRPPILRPHLPLGTPPSPPPVAGGVARSIGFRLLSKPVLVVTVAVEGYCIGEMAAPYTSVPATKWVCSWIHDDSIPAPNPQAEPKGPGPINPPRPWNWDGKTCESANTLPRCGSETFKASSAAAACRKCNGRGATVGRTKNVDKYEEVIDSTSFVYGSIYHTTCKIAGEPFDAVMYGMCCDDSDGQPRWFDRYKCAPHNFEND